MNVKETVCVWYSGFLGCEIPAASHSAAADDGGISDAERLKLTPQSKLTVISRPDDILLSFHSPSLDPQVIQTLLVYSVF